MKPMTIKDLANFLKVSPSTVSRALNNHPDISLEVRQRVQQLAEELQFKPNSFAANFRKKQSKLIAVVLPKIYRSFIPDVIEGITKTLKQNNYQTLILLTEDQIENEIAAIQQCCDMRVDGILLSLTNQTKNLDHLTICKNLGIPLVLFEHT
jgi:LacI family transcriptional regulator